MPAKRFTRLCCVLLLALVPAGRAEDYAYVTTNGMVTITKYTGPGGPVIIPAQLGGLPVTTIGYEAFYRKTNVISVALPEGVTSVGHLAFSCCSNLVSITIPKTVRLIGTAAFRYSGVTDISIPEGVTTLPLYAFAGCFNLTNVTIPKSAAAIAGAAFEGCTSLTSITIPSGVTYIQGNAFRNCSNLTSAYFWGNAPTHGWALPVFEEYTLLYYLPGTTGWDDIFWRPHVTPWWLPNPVILSHGARFGVQPGGFGFTISWATNADVVVEACADLANPGWLPLATNTLVQGSSYFSDPEWGQHSQRLYRVREK